MVELRVFVHGSALSGVLSPSDLRFVAVTSHESLAVALLAGTACGAGTDVPSVQVMARDAIAAVGAWRSVVGEPRVEAMPAAHHPLWRVVAEDGRHYVLKHLPEFPSGIGPVDEFRVLCYLQASGLPVAVPVVTDEGRLTLSAGDRAYALIPFLPNDPAVRESVALADTIGAGIGRLDRALADCPWQVSCHTDDPITDTLGDRLHRLPDALHAVVARRADALREALADLPAQLSHGDCNIGNVLVHDGRVTGYIDLDHLAIGPRVRDLSYYLATRLEAHINNANGDPDRMAAVLRNYVAGYHSVHPLTDRELAAVIPLMFTIEVAFADWSLHGWVPEPARYQDNARTIRWICKHYEQLGAAAALR